MALNLHLLDSSLYLGDKNCYKVNNINLLIRKGLGSNLLSNNDEAIITEKISKFKEVYNLSDGDGQVILELCRTCMKRDKSLKNLNKDSTFINNYVDFVEESIIFAKNNGISTNNILNFLRILMVRPFISGIEETNSLKLFNEIFSNLSIKSITEEEFILFVEKIKDSLFLDDFMNIFYFFNSLQFTKNLTATNLEILERKIQIQKSLQNN